MFRALFTLALAVASSAVLAAGVTSRTLGAPLAKNVAYLSQEVTLNGDMNVTARVAPLTVSSGGFGLAKNAVKLAGFPVQGMPVIDVANPTTQAAALSAAGEWVTTQLPGFKTRVAGWMKGQGLSTSVYSYTQEIMVSTTQGTKKRSIAFNVSIDPNGRPLYGAPKVIDADPTILEAMYTPAKVAEGLPTNWGYPGAGQIRYRVLNKKFEPLTAWKLIDTKGAFDNDPMGTDPDAKLACLMDRRYPSCAGPTDINTLMNDTGSSFAIVDYVRQVEPDYEEQADGSLLAKGAISVDARVWDCKSYINRGFFGYVLTMRAERYLAQPTTGLLSYQLVQQFGGKALSPTEPYEKSVPISVLNGAHPDGFIINPHPGATDLWKRSDSALMANVIYIAPVTAVGGDGELSDSSFSGDMAVRQISNTGSVKDYYIGTVGDNYWGSGMHSREVSFNIDDPKGLEELAIVQEGFDDHLLVAVNDTIVFVGPHGGNMLNYSANVPNSSCWSTPMGRILGQVQTRTNATGFGNGCYLAELNTSWVFNHYIDVRPYMQNGRNKLFMRTIVAGGGEGWIKLRTRSCGANLGLQRGNPPPVPSGAGQGGVASTVGQLAQ